jgi:hypothetical protein
VSNSISIKKSEVFLEHNFTKGFFGLHEVVYGTAQYGKLIKSALSLQKLRIQAYESAELLPRFKRGGEIEVVS